MSTARATTQLVTCEPASGNTAFLTYCDYLGSVDAVHALYYTVVYPWVAVFGISELSTRTPSAIALGLMAAILTRVGMIFGWGVTGSPQLSVQVGVTTAVITATLPGLTWAGQESRGYAMAMLAVVVALLYFDRFLRLLRTRDLVLFALAQAFAVGFSMYTLMLVPLYVVAAWMWQRLGVLRVGVAGAVITVSTLPLLVLGASQSEQVAWINTTVGLMSGRMYRQFFFSPANTTGPWGEVGLALAPWIAGVAILVIILGVIVARRRSELIWLIVCFMFPMVVLLGARIVGLQFYTERYLVFAAPFVVLVLALCLVILPWRKVSVLTTATLVVAFLPALAGQNAPESKIGHSYRTAAEFASPADTVICLEAVDRSLFVAYPPGKSFLDPMLQESPTESATLWGINTAGSSQAVQDSVGQAAVISYATNPEHDAVVGQLLQRGCVTERSNDQTRFKITVLSCAR